MTISIQHTIASFFSSHHDGRPVLLALSGGCDSLSLFLLLKEAKIPFHVAHVDHGWREESRFEAEMLRAMVEAENIPFHLHRISHPSPQGNLELQGREERLKFFGEICLAHNLQAVLTAHHADDQAETVMMRFLTQAPLERFSGILPVSKSGEITLWRPLLSHRRIELEAFLLQQKTTYFEDKSNHDKRRMRASLRHHLLPAMQQMTGRDITASLLSLNEQMGEMRSFFEEMAAPYLSNVEKGSLGWKWRVDAPLLQWNALLKFALRSFLAQAEFPYHRKIGEDIVIALQQGKANCHFVAAGKKIYVDRGVLMIPADDQILQGFPWKIKIEKTAPQEKASSCCFWEDLWKGDCHAFLPLSDVKIIPSDPQALYPGNQPIRLWWNKHKVPACLRTFAPLLVNADGRVVHEFLTGKVTMPVDGKGEWMKLGIDLMS